MPRDRRSRSQRQRESARFLKASQLKRLSELDSDSRRRLLLQSPDRSLSPLHRSYDPVTELPIFTCRYVWFIQLSWLNCTFLRPLLDKNFAKSQLRHRLKSVSFLNFFQLSPRSKLYNKSTVVGNKFNFQPRFAHLFSFSMKTWFVHSSPMPKPIFHITFIWFKT